MPRRPLVSSIVLLFLFSSLAEAQINEAGEAAYRSDEIRQRRAALEWADRSNWPVRQESADGSVVEIVNAVNGRPVFYTTQNYAAGQYVGTMDLHPEAISGYDLNGGGTSIAVWDAGAVFVDHQELQYRSVLRDQGSASNHATHVAGTLAAGGVLPDAVGMAPRTQIRSYNWNFHVSEMHVEARDGLLISNHSYGKISGWHLMRVREDSSAWYWFGDPSISELEDYTFGYYDYTAALFDNVVHSFPFYLPVVAAGNESDDQGPTSGRYLALDESGQWHVYDIAERPLPADGGDEVYDTIPSFALAKNVLTVGSIVLNPEAGSATLSVFSGRGPTDDGRIKPDIVAPGENLFSSLASGATDYGRYSGTSMAAPVVTGSLVLIQQLAKRLRNGPLRAATLKGLALHTATDMGPPGPDYQHGWGVMNAHLAAETLTAAFRSPSRIQEIELADRDTLMQDLYVTGRGPLRITLSWTDPSGPVRRPPDHIVLNNPESVLINDLDLRLVEKATGTRHFPYVLSSNEPSNTAARSDNAVDPVEQIYIPEATPGLYTLTVSHKGRLERGDAQPFSLILTGAEEAVTAVAVDTIVVAAEIGRIQLNWHTLFETTTGSFDIERASIAGDELASALGLHYLPLGSLPSHGYSEAPQQYEFIDDVLLQGKYRYRVVFNDGETSTRTLMAEVDIDVPAPEELAILSIYPNPFTDIGRLVLDLPESADISLTVRDMLGRTVVQAPAVFKAAGRHYMQLDASDWASGVYFAQVVAGATRLTQRFIVLR